MAMRPGPLAGMTLTGVTLIELLLVLLLLALLAHAAQPRYQDHLRAGKRSEARVALLRAAHWLESRATESGRYPDPTHGLPGSLAATPSGSYLIRHQTTDVEANGYTLTALPQGQQALDRCGAFTLAHTGVRALAADDAPAALVAECWNR